MDASTSQVEDVAVVLHSAAILQLHVSPEPCSCAQAGRGDADCFRQCSKPFFRGRSHWDRRVVISGVHAVDN